MSTLTTSDHPSESLEPSWTPNSSPLTRHENYAPRSTYNPTLLMRTSLPPPLLKESWLKYEKCSQNWQWDQCPCVHYLPYCNECRTLMGWEPPLPIKPTPKHSIMSFGKLKEYCKCCHAWREQEYRCMKKTCQQWREEQFAQAAYKRNATRAAWEA